MRDMWKIAIPSMLLLFTASACGEADQGAPEAPAVEESAPAEGAMEGTGDAMEDAGEAVEGAMEDAGEAVEGAMEDAGEAVEGAMEDAGEAMEGAAEDAKGAMGGMPLPE